MRNNVKEEYEANPGLRQGCMLSTLIFGAVLEWLLRKTERIGGLQLRGEHKHTRVFR